MFPIISCSPKFLFRNTGKEELSGNQEEEDTRQEGNHGLICLNNFTPLKLIRVGMVHHGSEDSYSLGCSVDGPKSENGNT